MGAGRIGARLVQRIVIVLLSLALGLATADAHASAGMTIHHDCCTSDVPMQSNPEKEQSANPCCKTLQAVSVAPAKVLLGSDVGLIDQLLNRLDGLHSQLIGFAQLLWGDPFATLGKVLSMVGFARYGFFRELAFLGGSFGEGSAEQLTQQDG